MVANAWGINFLKFGLKCSIRLEVANGKGKCCELLLKIKKVMERDVYMCVTCTVWQTDYLNTGMTNFSNSGKVERCGNSKAVLSYILSSNHPMARVFAFLQCNQDQ